MLKIIPTTPLINTHFAYPLGIKPNTTFVSTNWPTKLLSTSILLICSTGMSSSSYAQEQTEAAKERENKEQRVEIHANKPVQAVLERKSLNSDELLKMPGSGGDPLKAIQVLPGIALDNDGSAGAAVRGARPTDNAYYVDFLPVGYLFHMGGFSSVLNADLIRRFDVYSSTWGPQFGDVVGGVFDTSLRNPRTDRIGGKISNSMLAANVLVEGPLSDNTSFFLSARRSMIDLFVKEIKDEKAGTQFTFPSYNDVQGRLLWNINSKNRLRFDFNSAQDQLKFQLNKNSIDVQHDPILLGESAQATSYHTMAVSLESDLGSKTSNQLAVGRMVNHEKTKVGNSGGYVFSSNMNYLREQLTSSLGDHQLTVGADLFSNDIDVDVNIKNPRCTEFNPNCDVTSADYTIAKRSQNYRSTAAYLNDRWQLAQQWTLVGGLRATHDAYLKENFIDPRIGLEFAYRPDTIFSISAGKYHQEPSKDKSFPEGGNPALRSVRSQQVSAGVSQNVGQMWSWRFELYKKNFDQLAINDPLLNYVNGASGTSHGAELLVKGNLGHGLSGFVSVSLSKTKRQNDKTGEQFNFEFDQPVIAHAVLQYKASDKLQYGARWSYHTGKPDTPIIGTRIDTNGRTLPIFGAINSERLPAYHRLDLRVDYQKTERLSYYAELINAYARKNVSHYEYSADYSSRKKETQMPLFPSIGVEYKF